MFMCAQCVSVGGMGDTIMRYKQFINLNHITMSIIYSDYNGDLLRLIHV